MEIKYIVIRLNVEQMHVYFKPSQRYTDRDQMYRHATDEPDKLAKSVHDNGQLTKGN